MTHWDDPKALAEIDRSGMSKLLREFPEQAAQAWKLAVDVPEFERLAICGMGGSAIGGDFLRLYLARKGLSKPIFVIRNYALPPFVDEKTLVFAVSYSGNTEETLSCFEQALGRKCPLIAVTSGGKLAQLAQENGVRLISIPPGVPPRAALGYLFLPLLKSLKPLLDADEIEEEFSETLEVLQELAVRYGEAPEAKNPAKQLAQAWHKRIPVLYGSDHLTDMVAWRWKAQINENAKSPAYAHALPELSHNEIMGWEWPEFQTAFVYTLLRDLEEPRALHRRFELCRKLLEELYQTVLEVQGKGEGMLARLLSLSYLGDWSSYYLALLYGVDPTPVPLIEEIKKRLAAR